VGPKPFTVKNKFVMKMIKEPRPGRIIQINGPCDERGGACSTNVEKSKSYRLMVGKPEGKRPLGRPRRRWVDNIRVDLVQMGCGLDWSGSG
jgi:hypothetical protein